MRVGICKASCKAYGVHQAADFFAKIRRAFGCLINEQRLSDELADAHAGIQGREGILENHLNVGAKLLELMFAQIAYILTVKENLARGALVQMDYGAAQSGFSAAGFTDDAERLSLFNLKVDIIHRVEKAARGFKVFLKVFDFN